MYRYVSALSDINDYKYNAIKSGIIFTENSDITVGQFRWDGTFKCVEVNANKGYFRVPLGTTTIGDIIHVKCELLSDSGVNPHISIDGSNSWEQGFEDYTSGVESISTSGGWETVELTFTIPKNLKYTSAVVGLSTGEVGIYKLRNLEITVNTKISRNIVGTNYIIKKYDNGVMDIDYKTTLTGVNITDAWGQLFGCGKSYPLPDFPEKFREDIPFVQITGYATTGETMMTAQRTVPTATNPGSIEFIRATTGTNLTIDVHVHASGRYR